MAKRIVLFIACGVGVVGAWIGLRAQPAQDQPLCYLKNQKYSAGAMIREDEQIYRCYYVFGENLNSRTPGVAWVKMVRQGDTYIPKEPSDGR